MPGTIDRGPAPIRRLPSTSTAPIAVPNGRSRILRGSRESCRSMAIPASSSWSPKGIVLAACWAHTRRKFYEVYQETDSPIAAEALRRIDELYAVEEKIRGRSAELRRVVRQELARPLVSSLKIWLEAELHRVLPRSGLAEAIRYALVRWEALCRFLDDGRVELDTNTVERAIRPIALGRKNHLFAGSDGGADRWAIVCSLITTAKLNNREPYAYLKDVLERMTNGHPASRLDDLLPWNWTPAT